jgi:hypothetical protein
LASPLNYAAFESSKTKIPSKREMGLDASHRTWVSQRGAEECFFLTSSLIGVLWGFFYNGFRSLLHHRTSRRNSLIPP